MKNKNKTIKTINKLKKWDDVEIIFPDAHSFVGTKAWVSFDEFFEWSKNEEIYIHVTGKFIEKTDRFVKIVLGFGACFGDGKTDSVISPFAIPIAAILEIYKLRR